MSSTSLFSFIDYAKSIYIKHDFEIFFFTIIILLIIYAIFRKLNGTCGTWSKQNYKRLLSNPYLHKPLLKGNEQIPYGQIPYGQKHNKPPSDSKGELECRRVLTEKFGKPFDKIRPDFLINEVTGRGVLELDCYNDELKLACEYNGKQHYEYIPFFHSTKDSFYNQKYRDEMKKNKCKEKGIKLIEVPYTVPIDEIKPFIDNKLKELGF